MFRRPTCDRNTSIAYPRPVPRRGIASRTLFPLLALGLAAALGPVPLTQAQTNICGTGVSEETIMVYSNASGQGWTQYIPPRAFPATAKGLRDAVQYAATLPNDEVVKIPAGTYPMGGSPLVIPSGANTITLQGNSSADWNPYGGPTTISASGNHALTGAGLSSITVLDIAFVAGAGPGAIAISGSTQVALTCIYAVSQGVIVSLDGSSNSVDDSDLDGFNGGSLVALRLSGSSGLVTGNLIRSPFNLGTGVSLVSGSHFIVDNDIHHGRYCIKGEPGVDGSGVADNIIHNCNTGIELQGTDNNVVRNRVQGPLLETGIWLLNGSSNWVVSNTINTAHDFGLRLSSVTDSYLSDNTVSGSGKEGVRLEYSSNGNEFYFNTIGYSVREGIHAANPGGGSSNLFIDNTLICNGSGLYPAIRFEAGNGNIINDNSIQHWQTAPESDVIVLPAGHMPLPSGNVITPCLP
jgi:parallel beta-helix repeat protein